MHFVSTQSRNKDFVPIVRGPLEMKLSVMMQCNVMFCMPLADHNDIISKTHFPLFSVFCRPIMNIIRYHEYANSKTNLFDGHFT